MKRLVAIVEDEAAIRDNYAAAFTREGYAVRTYANRAQAMSAFAARLPDLAVIDISLAGRARGRLRAVPATARAVRGVPIIFLTARDSEIDAVSGLRLGADDFLTKDLSLAHLIARVNALFRRVEALRKPAHGGGESSAAARSPSMPSACRRNGTARWCCCRSPNSGSCMRWRATRGTCATASSSWTPPTWCSMTTPSPRT